MRAANKYGNLLRVVNQYKEKHKANREFRYANIRSLAAYEQARRALRGVCEPSDIRRRVRFLVRATRRKKKKQDICPASLFLVTRTGIEPMFSA